MDITKESYLKYLNHLRDASTALKGLAKKIICGDTDVKFVEVRVTTQKRGDSYTHPVIVTGDHPLASEYREKLQEHNIQQMQQNGLGRYESFVLLR